MSSGDKGHPRPWYRRRRVLQMAGAAGAGGLASLAGCSGSDGKPANEAQGTTSKPQTNQQDQTPTPSEINKGGTLEAGTQADITKLDPHKSSAYSSFQVLDNIYQRLTSLNKKLEPSPQLATDWKVSDDGTTWTFNLREGVKWHPPVSREFKARDVVYSINRILDPKTGSPRRSAFEPVKDVRAKDEHTVVFEFDKPYAPFLTKLTVGYIVPDGVDDMNVDISKQPVGTGPFKFKEHVSQSHTTITAFDDYWGKDQNGNQYPYLDAVKFTPIPEGSARMTNLRSGELHWTGSVPRSQGKVLEKTDSVHFSAIPGTWFDYLGHNSNKAPLDDMKVRQAISWAVDRTKFVKGARFGYGTPTQDPVPPLSVWEELINVDQPYEQNQEKAKRLLEESSYNGETIEIMVGKQYKGQVNEAEIAQEQLSQIGLNVEVQPTEWGTMVDRMGSGDFQMTVVGWIGFVDPDSMFYPLFHTGEKWNWYHYSNDKVDKLLEKGRRATGGRKKRAQYYDQAVDIIANEAPYTFLLFNSELSAWKPSVKGYTHYPTGKTVFHTVWIEE